MKNRRGTTRIIIDDDDEEAVHEQRRRHGCMTMTHACTHTPVMAYKYTIHLLPPSFSFASSPASSKLPPTFNNLESGIC